MEIWSESEPEPDRKSAQIQAWLEATDVSDDELAAFETFELPGEGELDVEDACGDHDIEYWVWSGNRLVPASPDKLARIRECEALDRLKWRIERERQERERQAWASRISSSLRQPYTAMRLLFTTFSDFLRGQGRRERTNLTPECEAGDPVLPAHAPSAAQPGRIAQQSDTVPGHEAGAES
jgi:hypothetical protein